MLPWSKESLGVIGRWLAAHRPAEHIVQSCQFSLARQATLVSELPLTKLARESNEGFGKAPVQPGSML